MDHLGREQAHRCYCMCVLLPRLQSGLASVITALMCLYEWPIRDRHSQQQAYVHAQAVPRFECAFVDGTKMPKHNRVGPIAYQKEWPGPRPDRVDKDKTLFSQFSSARCSVTQSPPHGMCPRAMHATKSINSIESRLRMFNDWPTALSPPSPHFALLSCPEIPDFQANG